MTTETQTNWIDWAVANSNKIKSIIGSVVIYIGAIEAAHPTMTFWEVFTSGFTGALTIAGGLITAIVSGYRTTETPGKIAQKRIDTITENNQGGH